MLPSNLLFVALAVTPFADAQGIKFGQILKKKPGLSKSRNSQHTTVQTEAIASSIIKHMNSIKPTPTHTSTTKIIGRKTSTKSGAKATAAPGVVGPIAPKVHALACAPAPNLYNYVPTDNSPTGFIVDPNLATVSRNALSYPAGYTNSFTNAYGSLFANNYMDAFDLSSYNASACAAYCNSEPGCVAFNLYFERQPSVWPADQCSNPSAMTGIRCALWGSQINAAQAQNVGQWRTNFMVVIQGSNGYNKNPAAPSVAGYAAAVPLSGAVDTRSLVASGVSDPFLSSTFNTGAFDPRVCANLCTSTTATNKQAAIAAGASSYKPCNFFNAVQLSLNGVSQGTYCQLYSYDVSSYTGLFTTTNAGTVYDLLNSNGYVASTQDTGVIVRATTTAAWTGTTTATSIMVSGTTGTILIQTPGRVSTSTSTGVSYTTVSANGGTALTLSTATLAPTVAGGASVVRVTYPTATSCNNAGIRYAAYQNVWAGGVDTYGNYTQYDPTSFKTLTPMYNGTTAFIAETNSGWTSWIKVYDRFVIANNLTLDHTFYVFANQDGWYSMNMPQGDNIVLVWLGAKAVSGWTRANADLTQYYTSSPTKVPQTVTVQLKMGQYLPVRLQWGNRQGDGEVDLNVYGPDGVPVMYSNLGQGTGWASGNVVQYPCDSSLGPQFPAWGQET